MTPTATSRPSVLLAWLERIRLAAAVAAAWALLHYVGNYILPLGSTRPVALVASPLGPLGGILFVLLLWSAAALATIISGATDPRRSLLIVGLGLALWCFEGGTQGGTIDAWLQLRNPVPGPPRGAPYALLLVDYLYLLLGLAGAYAAATLLSRRGPRQRRQAFGLEVAAREWQEAVVALLVTTVVAGVVIFVLTGPPQGATFRGQVYFAVGVAFLAGVTVARRLVKTQNPLWFLPAPLLVGIIGLVVASVAPALRLPEAYRQQNIIPAWGLARPLPVEMLALGLIGVLWLLHPAEEPSSAS
jgi:predicted membrane channel-forming protein YqfA (hemolysin III family)